ncbi:MAG: type IV pilus modification protein PilV [Xanthomonadales bacterium]|nr:type IV pilus modification protein PilV [Xanthomonadales bacterium]
MNRHIRHHPNGIERRFSGGLSLLEVLLAIVIFAIGMLALAQLQGNLARSSGDANARTVAANLAEETIESMRAFEVLETTPGQRAYQDIADDSFTVSRGGVDYNVAVTVEDWFFLPDRETVTKDVSDLPENRDTSLSDFKRIDLNVTWAGTDFADAEGRLGSGAFRLSSIVNSIPSLNNAKVAAEGEAIGTPPVNYTPGLNPDIVAISLDNSKFKESTTPEPIVRRRDALIETWFDVITYSQVGDEALFLRREEFAVVSCECTLRAPSGTAATGRRPTLWNGAEFVEGEFTDKQFGESASNQQSQYCDVCCQDHHDTGGGDTSYRPNDGNFTGNHAHFNRDRQGNFVEAAVGDNYLEACRLIRKDGFFRVAQDFSLNEVNAFPQDYLVLPSDIDEYSDHVRAVATAEFTNGSPPPSAADELSYSGRDQANRSEVDIAGQQLRSRGIYLDMITPALQTTIDNCFPTIGQRNEDCIAKDAQSVFEIYPFFDVQVTALARWTETQPEDPVDVSNEEMSSFGYSRGRAELAGSKAGPSTGHSTIEKSNVGLVGTIPIIPEGTQRLKTSDLFLQAGEGDNPPDTSGRVTISGTLSSQGGTSDAGIVSLTGSQGVSCTKPTNTTFMCILDSTELDTLPPTVTVSNYWKNEQTDLVACSAQLTILAFNIGTTATTNWTRFELPQSNTSGISITIAESPCG